MEKDTGASADADRATAVEPVPVSPLRDGIPSAWVVMRSVGEYSDRYETPAAIFALESEAEDYIRAADEQWRAASQLLPNAGWDVEDKDAYVRDWTNALTIDPGAVPSPWGLAEQPYYSSHETPYLSAQAIEARSDKTRRGLAEGESAVTK